MRLHQVLMFGAGLIMGANAYEFTVYNNVFDCNANKDSKYKIYEGNADTCIALGKAPPSDAKCSLYTDGGFADPAACGDDGFYGDSLFFNSLKTQVLGSNTCWECELFTDWSCEIPVNLQTDDKCQAYGGHGIGGVKCGPAKKLGGC
ncbi:hypothetical protein ETB97_005930 [Aspergillus alliaceus]|uniref:Uncharacterized protein n=1 Tax=Petromyces alliaceus TaxID=209559 RepID=A0A5N7CMA4_PETAA|nr:uncharacterized protein BDW43DRAFT_307919 [Aspergillus alliaceus]KAB8236905.1 hypothetical protein BDW43DRAFT_307919 [Aspergillus alliaceus]KAE8395225.1 hypothetical protein BDV23DRAFT_178747 [Aspergillus alliaceus]KAF5857351.1 hypothetical protein ETB97_005930 [Aspergillus burnettii]